MKQGPIKKNLFNPSQFKQVTAIPIFSYVSFFMTALYDWFWFCALKLSHQDNSAFVGIQLISPSFLFHFLASSLVGYLPMISILKLNKFQWSQNKSTIIVQIGQGQTKDEK